MPDWTKSMQQTFEFYKVSPNTWKDTEQIKTITSCSISRDSDSETLGSASFDITEAIDECYLRVYLITVQDGVREKFPLGTYLVQTPSTSYNGKKLSVSLDAYTPLIELKENPPDLGFSLFIGDNILDSAYTIVDEHLRAPVVKPKDSTNLYYNFVSDSGETWLSFVTSLIANANYEFKLDEMGRILFSPKQDLKSLTPVWTFDDGENSIFYPDVSIDRDLYNIPNAIEVIYSADSKYFYSRVENTDKNSPTSIPNRGRTILQRVTNPDLYGSPNQSDVDSYAKQLLEELSTLEYSISFQHGYCPVTVGDCVRLNYKKAGLDNVKAKIVSQTISCKTGCSVSATATFTNKLWG